MMNRAKIAEKLEKFFTLPRDWIIEAKTRLYRTYQIARWDFDEVPLVSNLPKLGRPIDPKPVRLNPEVEYHYKFFPFGNDRLLIDFYTVPTEKRDAGPFASIMMQKEGRKLTVWGARAYQYTPARNVRAQGRGGLKKSHRPSFVSELSRAGRLNFSLEINHPKNGRDRNRFLLCLWEMKLAVERENTGLNILVWFADQLIVHNGQEYEILRSEALQEPMQHRKNKDKEESSDAADMNTHPTVM